MTPAETLPSFGSDDHRGGGPETLAAFAAANRGHVHAYGDDRVAERAEERIPRGAGGVRPPRKTKASGPC